jgi:hypothetical protein
MCASLEAEVLPIQAADTTLTARVWLEYLEDLPAESFKRPQKEKPGLQGREY